MSNVLLAAFGTFITMLALTGFSIYQLDKTDQEAGGPPTTDRPAPPAATGGLASESPESRRAD